MPNLIDEPDLLERLAELDRGLFDDASEANRHETALPPLIERLIIPQSDGQWRQICQGDASGSAGNGSGTWLCAIGSPRAQDPATPQNLFREQDVPRREEQTWPPPLASATSGSALMMSAYLVLSMLLGAAGAAFTFQDQFTAAVVQLESRLR